MPTRKRRSDPQRKLPATHARASVIGRSRPTPANRHPSPIGTDRRPFTTPAARAVAPARARKSPRSPIRVPLFSDLTRTVRISRWRSAADLQKMAVAEWLQSFNRVRGPIETLGIMWVLYTGSSCSSGRWKPTTGSQEIWRKLVISWRITGLAQNPLHALFWPSTATQKSQEISLWVAMALRDPCKTRWLACKITGGNSQPIVRSWLVEQPIRLHFYAVSSALPAFSLQPPFFGG